jgi:hypothetical protein
VSLKTMAFHMAIRFFRDELKGAVLGDTPEKTTANVKAQLSALVGAAEPKTIDGWVRKAIDFLDAKSKG